WRKRREPATGAQSRVDPVPAVVPDPRRAVLGLPAPAAALAPAAVRPGQPGAVHGGVHGRAALGARLCQPRARTHVAADPCDLGRLRRVPGRPAGRGAAALVALAPRKTGLTDGRGVSGRGPLHWRPARSPRRAA